MKQLFPANMFSTIFNSIKNLKELLALSKYLSSKSSRQSSVKSCFKCDIFKSYMVFGKTFKSMITSKVYYIKGEMNCKSPNIIYLNIWNSMLALL